MAARNKTKEDIRELVMELRDNAHYVDEVSLKEICAYLLQIMADSANQVSVRLGAARTYAEYKTVLDENARAELDKQDREIFRVLNEMQQNKRK